jgi:hypothetical protein
LEQPADVTTVTPEEVFDRYFRSPDRSEQDRGLFCGRDSLWDQTAGQQALLRDIQKHLNGLWAQQLNRHPNKSELPPIHVDFIDTRNCGAGQIRDRRVINAVAFEDRGIAFIGLTRDLLEELFRTSWLIAKNQRVRDGFRIFRSATHLTSRLATTLVTAQLVFVINHELGHHVHGHVRSKSETALHVEFGSAEALNQTGALISQRKEIDADGYAVTSGLNNFLLAEGPRRSALASLARPVCHPLSETWLVRLYVLAAGAFFFARPGIAPSRDGRVDLRELTHPPGLVRMHYVMHQLRAWAARNQRGGLLKWASEIRFQRLMAGLEDAIGSEHQEIDWHEQSRFWASESGGKYRQVLDESEPVVRAQFLGKCWNI